MTKKKRIAISLDPQLAEEVGDIAHNITKERGKYCPVSELCAIALTAFVVGYHKEKERKTN